MDTLVSHHTITEHENWILLMERVVEEDEENLKGAVGSKVIQEYLQRYKVQQKLLHLKDFRFVYLHLLLQSFFGY